MGRALHPTRRLRPAQVKAGDVVLVRSPATGNSRWMLVDYAEGFGRPYVWSGRWAFGADAGTWTIQVEHTDTTRYTVKDAGDAQRDHRRLNALRAERVRRAQRPTT